MYDLLGVYIAETVHPSIRNNLTIIPSIFMSAGFLLTWVVVNVLSSKIFYNVNCRLKR